MTCKECLFNKRCSKINDDADQKAPIDWSNRADCENCVDFKNRAIYAEVKHFDIVQLPIAGEPKYRCGNIQCAREVKKEFIYCPYCGGLLKR